MDTSSYSSVIPNCPGSDRGGGPGTYNNESCRKKSDPIRNNGNIKKIPIDSHPKGEDVDEAVTEERDDPGISAGIVDASVLA